MGQTDSKETAANQDAIKAKAAEALRQRLLAQELKEQAKFNQQPEHLDLDEEFQE